jgi:hypothetical protein
MRYTCLVVLVALAGLTTLGCGNSGKIKAKGRIVKSGQPFLAEQGEGLRIFFDPVEYPADQYDSYAAEYHPKDGSFEVEGKDRKGLPPGTYRVSLQLMKSKEDLLKGAAMGKQSPFQQVEVSGKNEIVLDLDQVQPSAKQAVAAPGAKKTQRRELRGK